MTSSKVRSSFAYKACLLCLIFISADIEAEVLTGIVRQPTAPFLPAPESKVVVYAATGGKPIAGPDSTDASGRYTFNVKKGTSVIVNASWRSDLSTPGSASATVASDPTTKDVQLQPAKSAPEAVWKDAGVLTAKTSGPAVTFVVSDLQRERVASASVFQFISGVRSVDRQAYAALNSLEMFNPANAPIVARGVAEAEKQFHATGSVPTLEQLNRRVPGQLTEKQHSEILGFIAPPSGSSETKRWEDAVGKAVAFKKVEILQQRSTFDTALLQDAGKYSQY